MTWLGLLALLAASVPAHAQDAPQGRVHVGSSLSFTPAVVIVGGYDTNRIRATGGTPDSELIIAPQVEGWLGRGRTRVNFVGALESQNPTRTSSTLNNFLRAQIDTGPRTLRVQASAGRRDHYAPPTDFVGFEIGIRSRRVETEYTGGVTYAPGRLSIGARAEHFRLRYAADARFEGSSLRANLNQDTTWTSLEAGLRLTPLSALSASVSFIDQRFLFAPVRDGAGVRAMVGGTFQPAALVSGYAMAGFLRYETKATRISYQGPAYLVGLYFARRGVVVDLQGIREIGFSFDPSRGFYLTNGVDLYTTATIATRWQPFLRASLRGLTPQGPARAVEPFRGIQLAKAGLVFRATRHARIGTDLERYVYGGPGGFRGTRATLFLIYGSESPQRLDRPLPGQF